MSLLMRVLRRAFPSLYKSCKGHVELLKTVKQQTDSLKQQNNSLVIRIDNLEKQIEKQHDQTLILLRALDNVRKMSEENLWAAEFNNTIVGSKWLGDLPLSPGNWAMGYPELYVLYRVLDEARPQKI
ncbi:MAG: hypothetical protein IJU30_04385, partial [Lachnospiraceae bacterium]|nr:hypothetical protein [Lachnospiraceae bacterium]